MQRRAHRHREDRPAPRHLATSVYPQQMSRAAVSRTGFGSPHLTRRGSFWTGSWFQTYLAFRRGRSARPATRPVARPDRAGVTAGTVLRAAVEHGVTRWSTSPVSWRCCKAGHGHPGLPADPRRRTAAVPRAGPLRRRPHDVHHAARGNRMSTAPRRHARHDDASGRLGRHRGPTGCPFHLPAEYDGVLITGLCHPLNRSRAHRRQLTRADRGTYEGAGQRGRTFAAWGPFWPWVTSNSTFWPSVSSR